MPGVSLARVFRVVVLLSLANVVLPASQVAAADGRLSRGVLVDARGETGYVAVPGGGIDAIDLASGRTLWSTEEGALPLALIGPNLVAQVEEPAPASHLRIVIFDVAARGRRVMTSSIALPEGVYALVADELERTFRATAQGDGEDIVVSWTFTKRSMKGMESDGPPEPPRVVVGSARIERSSGRVVDVPFRRVTTDALAERLMQENRLEDRPLRSGNVLAMTEGGRGGPLRLKRWDATTGQPLPDRELLPKAIVALASADGAHLVATERVGAGGAEDPEYLWSVFSAGSGELEGRLRRDTSAAPFVVTGDNVVFEDPAKGYRVGDLWIDEPLKLRAVRLSTSVPLWEHELRELRYRGRVPPSPPAAAPPKPAPAPAPAKSKRRGHC